MTTLKQPLYRLQLRPGTFEVRELTGREAMSSPFRFEAQMVVEDGFDLLEPDHLPGTRALLLLERGTEILRRVRGIVTEATVSATASGEPVLTVVVEPRLVRTRYRKDARVFRDMSVPAIVGEVLTDAGVPHIMRLPGEYTPRPYCVQMCETDFAFVSRLLEDEGIFYFFADDLDNDFDDPCPTMIIGDHIEAYERIAGDPVLLHRSAAIETDTEVVHRVGRRAQMSAGSITLRDYNPATPELSLEARAAGPSEGGVEHYDFPGNYTTVAEGQRKANLRAAALACQAEVVIGSSTCTRLGAGFTFQLQDSTIDDDDYLVVRIDHDWRRSDPFDISFEALPARTVFRPPVDTPRPALRDPLTGFVTGPKGADRHTDELARVKVRFPWDRRQPNDDTVSDWIPVLQDDTGQSLSFPRIGWEVMVGFFDGNPDRPVVLGRLYNAVEPFPEPLPEGKTRSSFRSLTTPTRVGYNEIKIDDAAGSELVTIQAQKNQNTVIANDKTENVLNTESNKISGSETITVGGNASTVVGADQNLIGDANQTIDVGGNRVRQVALADTSDILVSRTMIIGGSHIRKMGQYDTVSTVLLNELVGAVDVEASLKKNARNAGKLASLTVGGAIVEASIMNKTEIAGATRTETVGGAFCSFSSGTHRIQVSGPRTTSVGGMLEIEAEPINITGTIVSIDAGASATYGDASIVLTTGGATVAITPGSIVVTAASITIDAGANALKSGEAQHNP